MSRTEQTRREFMATVGLGAAATVVPGALVSAHPDVAPEGEEMTNIVFMLADDLGYGDLGCYGQQYIRTPHIDRMAQEGVRFTQCYAGSTVCAPCRSVLMTGQHTGHTRVRGNKGMVGGVGGERRIPLEPEDVTVAQLLKSAGYATGITGKWGLGEPETAGVPTRKGFDEWFGYLNQKRAHTYYPDYLWHNEEKVVLEGNQEGKRESYSHDMITDFALDFIYRHKEEPFLLYLPWCIPHAAYEIPSIEPYTDRDWREDAKAYAAMVTRMDRDVGRITALLQALNLEEKTIVFFTSDNGAARRWDGLFDSSGPLRGHKRDMYEGGIRTPMIVRWPGKIPPGTVSDAVWYFADFLPTAAALAGTEAPRTVDGMNVLPTILGENQNLSERFLYWEYFGGGFHQAVRWGDWKAVRGGPDRPLEVYNLAEDVSEQRDVADRHPEVVRKIEEFLKTARTKSPNWPLDR